MSETLGQTAEEEETDEKGPGRVDRHDDLGDRRGLGPAGREAGVGTVGGREGGLERD